MEVSECEVSYVPRMVAAEKLNSVRGELRKLRGNHRRLIIDLQLTRKVLERMKKESKAKNVRIESLREAFKARTRGGVMQVKGPGEGSKTPAVQELCTKRLVWLSTSCVPSGSEVCKVGYI